MKKKMEENKQLSLYDGNKNTNCQCSLRNSEIAKKWLLLPGRKSNKSLNLTQQKMLEEYISNNGNVSVSDICKERGYKSNSPFYIAVRKAVKLGYEPNDFISKTQCNDKCEEVKEDELLNKVIEYVTASDSVSTSLLQRKFGIGYNRAAKIVDHLEEKGLISSANGSKPREVIHQKDKAEFKEERAYLIMKPSLKEQSVKYAEEHGISFNELVSEALEMFINYKQLDVNEHDCWEKNLGLFEVPTKSGKPIYRTNAFNTKNLNNDYRVVIKENGLYGAISNVPKYNLIFEKVKHE